MPTQNAATDPHITPEEFHRWTGEDSMDSTQTIEASQGTPQEVVTDIDEAPADDMPDDFDPAEYIEQERDKSDDALLEAGAKECEVCGKPVEYKTGCDRCTVPAKKWVFGGWGRTRHLPDKTDTEYVTLLNSYGYDDHEMVSYFNDYMLAMARFYDDLKSQEFMVAYYLFSVCEKSARVSVSYSAIKKATGVDRNTLRGRKGAKAEPLRGSLKASGT